MRVGNAQELDIQLSSARCIKSTQAQTDFCGPRQKVNLRKESGNDERRNKAWRYSRSAALQAIEVGAGAFISEKCMRIAFGTVQCAV
ncbi:9400_t:CDS:2 [Paraglomus occultum]|uniref:9400_t:CDS:1 n=1 Tax=Paraglomus occultum TaxID=144539 RepID=A0A9N8VG70_9GLOM|nr:9400_t:CDS:2 [Paraglomus occultum]